MGDPAVAGELRRDAAGDERAGRHRRRARRRRGCLARPRGAGAVTVRIGLTGPIGCGKSTVAGWLGERPGVVVIDADRGRARGRRARRAGARRGRRAVRRGAAARRRVARPGGARADRLRRPGRAARPRGDHPSGGPAADPGARSPRPRRTAPPAVVIEAIKLVEGGLAERLRRGLARDLRPGGPARAPRRPRGADRTDADTPDRGPGAASRTASGPLATARHRHARGDLTARRGDRRRRRVRGAPSQPRTQNACSVRASTAYT